MYVPIALPESVPLRVRQLVAGRVDMFLSDVHAMLRLPLPVLGINAGCNFAVVEVLCAVISGLSRVFRSDVYGAGKAFEAVLEHYPHDEEPNFAISGKDFRSELYDTYRCNLVHSLGINVSEDAPRKIVPLLRRTVVRRYTFVGPPDPWINSLENEARPGWLKVPTLYDDAHGSRKLCAEALYWGTRRLTLRLCLDPFCVSRADSFLERAEQLLHVPLIAPNYYECENSATYVSSTTGSAAGVTWPHED